MRLIDADELKNDIECLAFPPQDEREEAYNNGIAAVIEFIDNAKTVDAVPVVHAHLIKESSGAIINDFQTHYYKCSHCRYVMSDRYGLYKYCPNCGARMDTYEKRIFE